MLIVHGTTIRSSEDPAIVRAFGESYTRAESTNEMIDWYINDTATHRFASMSKLNEAIAGLNGSHLILQRLHPRKPGPYSIIMQGNRTDDYAEANTAAGLMSTPANYTWHHKEGLSGRPPRLTCQMYLVLTTYHSRVRHVGGVHEYETRTGTTYR